MTATATYTKKLTVPLGGNRLQVYEVKPDNARGAIEGRAQLNRYVEALRAAGYDARPGQFLPTGILPFGAGMCVTVRSDISMGGASGLRLYAGYGGVPDPITVPVKFPQPQVAPDRPFFNFREGLKGGVYTTTVVASLYFTRGRVPVPAWLRPALLAP